MTDVYDLLPLVADVIDDDGWEGDPPPTFEQRSVTLNVLDVETRCEQSIRAIRNLDSRRAALVAELDRLKAKLNAIDNRRESVRNYLRGVMVLMGTRKVRTPIATASLSPGRERIVFADDLLEQAKYWPSEIYGRVLEIKETVRKDVLREQFSDRLKDLPGVSIECGEDVLTIR